MTLPVETRRIVLRKRPNHGPIDELFELITSPISEPGDGEIFIRVDVSSLDPAQRNWIKDIRSYLPPVQLGETMRAFGIATVLASGPNTTLRPGDQVSGFVGWAEYAVVQESTMRKINPNNESGVTVMDYLGPLGLTGLTAYFGILRKGGIQPGQTVVISGAAGATGSMACQIAQNLGAKVYGIAGSTAKCSWLVNELRIDGAYCYKDQGWKEKFEKEVGLLDVYFDNVGGEMLDYFLTRLNIGARTVLCGTISDATTTTNATTPYGIINHGNLIRFRASMNGFLVLDYTSEYPTAEADITQWMRDGKIRHKFHVESGLEKCPHALKLLFSGGNTGKLVVKISKESSGW
ncbi:NAD(P)-binding protein [Clavulina sp. PMI_390]|nr:NAD(P)-binding protein [Clavulina sp. PMI_390]